MLIVYFISSLIIFFFLFVLCWRWIKYNSCIVYILLKNLNNYMQNTFVSTNIIKQIHLFLSASVLIEPADLASWNALHFPLVSHRKKKKKILNPLMPGGNYSYQFFICCPRDCVSRHNGGTSGAPLKPLRVDSALCTSARIVYTEGAVLKTSKVFQTKIENTFTDYILKKILEIIDRSFEYRNKIVKTYWWIVSIEDPAIDYLISSPSSIIKPNQL